MIKNFTCKDFRNVECDHLSFARINILIGPNNAGKSNFIRALSFAANMVNANASDDTGFLTELNRNGWNRVINRKTVDSEFTLKWEFELKKSLPVEYTLKAHAGVDRKLNYISGEILDSRNKKGAYEKPYNYFDCHSFEVGKGQFSTAGIHSRVNNRVQTAVNSQESVLLQMDNLFFKDMRLFSEPFVRDNIREVLALMKTYFHSFYSYACTSFNIAEIRSLQDMQASGEYLKKDASNFVNVYYDALLKDPNFESRYLYGLKRMISSCSKVEVKIAGGKIWMELHVDGESYSLSEVSDGTVHLLVLLLLLNLPEENGISMLAIDEPEMNLHPAWQNILATEILSCKGFKQCFLSTHSPEFLDEFTEDFLKGKVNVFVFDPFSRTPIRQLDRNELSDDLAEWSLGDLYRVGDPMIGGWPQ